MIQRFIDRFMANTDAMRAELAENHPGEYRDLVHLVVRHIADEDDYGNSPDPDRIHEIDDGDYQGTLLFVIGANDYQPSTYWFTSVSYGSCSGCDTFQSIKDYSNDKPTEEQIDGYMTLALHLVQGMKSTNAEEAS